MPSLQSPGTCRPSAPMSAGDFVHLLRLWAGTGAPQATESVTHQALKLVTARTASLCCRSEQAMRRPDGQAALQAVTGALGHPHTFGGPLTRGS